jgi:branched-chain amino acid transport system ATP-binding protein
MQRTDPAMLDVHGLCAGYGGAQILFDLNVEVGGGEVVVLLGRNGAGKSTTLKTIAGLLRATRGEIRLDQARIDRLPPYLIARAGVGYVPEDRRIFTSLSIAENLEVGRQPPREGLPPWTFDRLCTLFPNLAELPDRPGGRISGGEQQMLAIARALMGNPRLLLLDEPTEGLAPIIVAQLAQALRDLKRQGVSILLSEQNLRFSEAVADRAYALESGHILFAGTMREFANDVKAREELLGLA